MTKHEAEIQVVFQVQHCPIDELEWNLTSDLESMKMEMTQQWVQCVMQLAIDERELVVDEFSLDLQT